MSDKGNSFQSAVHCIGLSFAALLLRLFIALRLIFAGLEKWKTRVTEVINEDTGESVTYWTYKVFGEGSQQIYNENMGRITSNMVKDSPLRNWMIDLYANSLGWLLLGVGVWVLTGLFSRGSLIAAGFVFVSLTFGLATIGADPEIVERGIEIAIVAGALALARYQVLGVDGLIRLALGGGRSKSEAAADQRLKD